MVNASALYGSTATFACTITGAQGIGETLSFSKVDNGVSTLISSDATVANATKHSVAGTYTMTVNDVVWTDEGEYTCALGLAAANTAYLTVGVAATDGWIYWNDNMTYTKKDVKANLTCESDTARPPSTFRWFRGTAEVTTGIINPSATVDASGYGTSKSMIEMTPADADEGILYTCHIDAAGKQSAITRTLTVSFSGAGTAVASLSLLIAAVITTLDL